MLGFELTPGALDLSQDCVRQRGVEPRPRRWQRHILTAELLAHESIQHCVFPRAPAPQYWQSPMVLNFRVRMGSGVLTMV